MDWGSKVIEVFFGSVARVVWLCSDIDFKLGLHKDNEQIREKFQNKSCRLLNYLSKEPKISSIRLLGEKLWEKYKIDMRGRQKNAI